MFCAADSSLSLYIYLFVYVCLYSCSSRADLRERVHRAFCTVATGAGVKGNSTDNRQRVGDMLLLADQRARMLGRSCHAELSLEEKMAGHPRAAFALLHRLLPAAQSAARVEVAMLVRALFLFLFGDLCVLCYWKVCMLMMFYS